MNSMYVTHLFDMVRYGSIFVTNIFCYLHCRCVDRTLCLLTSAVLGILWLLTSTALWMRCLLTWTLWILCLFTSTTTLWILCLFTSTTLCLMSRTMMSPHTSSPSLAKGFGSSKVTRWASLLFPGWARSLIWTISSTFSLQGYFLVSVNLLWILSYSS